MDEIELCWYHFRLAGETFIECRSVFGSKALAEHRARREAEREFASEAGRPTEEEWREKRSVVYYVRLGDHIKIGHTIHLKERMSSLRVDDMSTLLAAEPGYWSREAERHTQFAAERLGRRENFNPSRRLMAHIALVRSKYGDPMEYAKRLVAAAGPHTSVQTTPRIHPSPLGLSER